MIEKFITVLFILSILSSFYPGQILSAERNLKICPLSPKFVKSFAFVNVGDDTFSPVRKGPQV